MKTIKQLDEENARMGRLPEHSLSVIHRLGKKDIGNSFERTKYEEKGFYNREKAFAEAWQKENRHIAGINYGYGILQNLFIYEENPFTIIGKRYSILKITPVHRYIVATVIQWLGSNVGWCFLGEVLKKCGYKIVKIEDKP